MSGVELEVRVTHCIEDIGQEGWDAFSEGRPFASHGWYRYGEHAMAGCTPLYLSVFHCGQMVARASFWLVPNEPLPVGTLSRPVRGALQAFLRARPLLICRSPVADASGLILPPPPLRQPALEAILSAARAFGRRARASFLVFDYLDPCQAALPDWPDGLTAYHLDQPGTSLPIPWASFDDYLAGLSRSARKDYRRQHNQAERLGVEIYSTERVGDLEEALPLIRAVEERHGSLPKPWAAAMLENAHQVPATWITARVGGRLAGCGLLLSDQGVQMATLMGLNYDYSYIYFQIIYRAIRESIAQGASLLRAGSGAYELKQRLGFQPEDNDQLRFTGQGRLLSWIGSLAAG